MGPLLLLKVSLLLAVTLAAARLLSRAPATARHGLWSLAFGSILLLAPLAASLPALHVPVPAAWESAPPPPSTASTQSSPLARPEASATLSTEQSVVTSTSVGPVTNSPSPVPGVSWSSLSTLLFGAWLTGMIAALTTVLVSLVRVHRLIRTAEVVTDDEWRRAAAVIGAQLGVRHPVRLLVSPHVSTPMAGGVWRPAIFLPRSASSWSAEHRELVLAHELAHLAGHDPLRHLMTRFALACYWFHPLAWLAAREAAIAREQACDETVLAMGARRSAYARVLLDLAESMSVTPRGRLLGALPMVHRSHLETRLMAILNGDVRPTTRRLVAGPAIGVALLTLSVAAATPALSGVEIQAGVATRVPVGVAAAVQGGVAVGVPGGVAVGVPGGVAVGVPGGVAAGVPGGVAAGVPGGVAVGVPGGVAVGVPGGVAVGVPGGVAVGVPGGAAVGVPGGTAVGVQVARDSACWADDFRGNFHGSSSSARIGGRTVIYDQVGWRDGDRIIQRSFGDLRLCMLAEGAGDRNNPDRPSQWIGRARRVVMEAHRGNTVQRLEFNGSNPTWQVGGATRDFDSAAQTWRDRMLAVLDTTWELSTLRGEESSLRGQISSIQGQRSSLQGQISSLQGQVSSMQGRISSIQGQVSSLRGQISSIQGHVSSLQGAISSEQGAISSLTASRYSADAAQRSRIADRIADHRAQIARIEREIDDYDADRRIAAVEREIDAVDARRRINAIEDEIHNFDLDGKVRAIQRRIEDLDVRGKVAGIERQIERLDVPRRSAQLEDRLDAELPRLTSAISAIR